MSALSGTKHGLCNIRVAKHLDGSAPTQLCTFSKSFGSLLEKLLLQVMLKRGHGALDCHAGQALYSTAALVIMVAVQQPFAALIKGTYFLHM